MRRRLIASLTLPLMIASLVGCQPAAMAPTAAPLAAAGSWPAAGTEILRGRAVFPGYAVLATSAEVAARATITLIDAAGTPRAAGTTDASGHFVLYQSTEPFTPTTGATYVLEATRRLIARGDVLSLRTVVQWEGTRFTSITGTEVLINATTTALAELLTRDNALAPAALMGLVTSGTSIGALAGYPAEVLDVRVAAVTASLSQDRDPLPASGPLAWVGDIVVTDAADLEDFDHYGRIAGNLTFSGPNAPAPAMPLLENVDGYVHFDACPQISSVAGLAALRKLGGLILSNTGITTLAGLNLTGFSGMVTLTDNPSLASLPIIPGEEVGEIFIVENPSLASLTGLEGVRAVDGDLTIARNAALATTEALAGLTRIGEFGEPGDIVVLDNPALTAFHLPDGLTSHATSLYEKYGDIGVDLGDPTNELGDLHDGLGVLAIANNGALTRIDGGANLEGYWSFFALDNPALTAIEGFDGVTQVANVGIEHNGALTSLAGLASLEQALFTVINDNTSLSSLAGLGALAEGSLFLRGLPALTSFAGLELGGEGLALAGVDLPSVTSLAGLGEVSALKALVLANCGLTTLEGIADGAQITALFVLDAPELTDASALSQVTFGGEDAPGGKILLINTGVSGASVADYAESVLTINDAESCVDGDCSPTAPDDLAKVIELTDLSAVPSQASDWLDAMRDEIEDRLL